MRSLFLTIIFLASFSLRAEPNILVLGDSISAAFGLKQNQGWVELLQKRLVTKDYPYNVINASISGETSGGGLRRVNHILTKHNPDIVLIALGANDGLRGLKLSQLKSNLLKIVGSAHNIQAKVIILGMKLPPNYGPAYTQAFSEVFFEVSKLKKTSLVPFMFEGFESDLQYFQSDRIHPNAIAQPLILDNIWPTLLPLLKQK